MLRRGHRQLDRAARVGLAVTEGVAVLLGLYKMATTPRIERGGLIAVAIGSDPETPGG